MNCKFKILFIIYCKSYIFVGDLILLITLFIIMSYSNEIFFLFILNIFLFLIVIESLSKF